MLRNKFISKKMQLCVLGNEIQWVSLTSRVFVFIVCWAPDLGLLCRVHICISAFPIWEVHLPDPRRQFLIKMSGHGFKAKLIHTLCPTTMAHIKIAECWPQKVLNYAFSLNLVAFVGDFSRPCIWMTFIFVHLQLYWLVNHSPCCSLMVTEIT